MNADALFKTSAFSAGVVATPLETCNELIPA